MKLTNILEHFGHRCLLILDGYDECALGQNENLIDILSGLKFENCNIILTSRPHSIVDIENNFDTIVSVEGFTRNEAQKFASHIVPDEEKVENILNFDPAGKRDHPNEEEIEDVLDFNLAGERSDRPVHSVPILLSFLCLLVREENIDLSDKTISMGEIYFRMVQCLYKRFTIRKGIKFEKGSLITVLKSVGKLALETLLSGKPELERSKIIEQVGEEVFEYGLLIGEDGFSLTRDMAVDTLVTFPHRSLQEFLGAFYFVLSLGKKQTVNDVELAFQEYLKNPLFSEFCLWLLDESNKLFSFPEHSVACQTISIYVKKQIDAVEVDFVKLEKNYPALSLALRNNRNEIALKILEGALAKCSQIKNLVIKPYHPVTRILRSISPFIFQRLNSIKTSNFQEKRFELTPQESPLQFLSARNNQSFNLTVKCELDALNTLLKVSEISNRSVYLHVIGGIFEILINHDFPSVHTFHIDSSYYIPPMCKTYPQLVNLFLTDCGLSSRDMSNLAEASKQGRLPKLSTLDLSDNPDIGGNLSMVLSHCFPSLHTLILSSCKLQISDVHNLAQARTEARLPQLRHLDVSFNYDLSFAGGSRPDKCLLPLLFQQGLPTLNTLVVQSYLVKHNDPHTLYPQAWGSSKFLSELTTLDISLNPSIKGSLSTLMCHYLSHLQILILRYCQLNAYDMQSLGEASNEGRLPELRHLDITRNNIGGKKRCLFRLFEGLKGFPSLINLILIDCYLELQDLCCLTQANLDGKLPRIRHLDISLNGLSDHVGILSRDPITQREISWGNVKCYDYNKKVGSLSDYDGHPEEAISVDPSGESAIPGHLVEIISVDAVHESSAAKQYFSLYMTQSVLF